MGRSLAGAYAACIWLRTCSLRGVPIGDHACDRGHRRFRGDLWIGGRISAGYVIRLSHWTIDSTTPVVLIHVPINRFLWFRFGRYTVALVRQRGLPMMATILKQLAITMPCTEGRLARIFEVENLLSVLGDGYRSPNQVSRRTRPERAT